MIFGGAVLTARERTPLVTLITDPELLADRELFGRVDRLASLTGEERSRFAIQLRSPTLSTRDLVSLGRALRERTRALGVRLIVNDRIDVALLLSADGVHLGRHSVGISEARRLVGDHFFMSIACHSVDDVLVAGRSGATACTLSPIFPSLGKGSPLGVGALREARGVLTDAGLDLGLVALGGVDASSAASALASGADGVATVRAEVAPRLLLA